MDKLATLNPVNYNFIASDKISLPTELQHGFLAQNLETVFPELIKPVKKPVFDKEGKFVAFYEYKSVIYVGLITVLTASIKELQAKVEILEKQNQNIILTEALSKDDKEKLSNISFSMEQNIPNPFDQQTTINYTTPKDTRNLSIMVFDMSGKLLKEYELQKNVGTLTINASELGKGMFLYSMVNNGSDIITKKMIVK